MGTEVKINLIELIKLFPWLVDIADSDYDNEYANQKLVEEAYKILRNRIG